MTNWDQFTQRPKRSPRPRSVRTSKLTKTERRLQARIALSRVKHMFDQGHLNTQIVYEEVQRATNSLTTDEISRIMEMPYWEILERFGESN